MPTATATEGRPADRRAVRYPCHQARLRTMRPVTTVPSGQY
jgi:hypothetical protein